MTLPLRMKRQITRPARMRWMRRAASLLVLSLGLSAGQVFAQVPLPDLPSTPPVLPSTPPAPAPQKEESDLLRTAAQVPGPGKGKATEQEIDFTVSIELPGPQRLFSRDSEADLFDRLTQEAKTKPGAGRIFFVHS